MQAADEKSIPTTPPEKLAHKLWGFYDE